MKKFRTPKEAEKAFYDAMERADIRMMKSVWSDDDQITCIHPGVGRLEGRVDVVGSFHEMFKDAPTVGYSITDSKCSTIGDIAIHQVREEIDINGQLISVMMATNIYRQVNGGWYMMLHHASPEPDPDFDEIEYMMEVDEEPVVLH